MKSKDLDKSNAPIEGGKMNYETILYQKDGALLTITLNRPNVLNAMNGAMKDEIKDAIGKASSDDEIRCIILTGSGKSFCAGNDMKAGGGAKSLDDQRKRYHKEVVFGFVFWDCPKPIIAAVNGHCLGTGCEMALACDLTIAGESAKFGLPEVRHSAGANILIEPWTIGIKRTKELLFTGNAIDAQQAEKWGMVNRVVPDGKLIEESNKLARKIAAVPAYAVQISKLGVNRTYENMGLKQSIIQNAELIAILNVTDTPEKIWFRQLVNEKGLNEALKARAEKYKD
jgi:enoyl-CoA hydratase/carnithine racemase